jgi:release factor glutamine methyltransferase
MTASLTPLSLKRLLTDAQAKLAGVSGSPRLEAEVLLAHALEQSRSYLYSWPERILDSQQICRFAEGLARRLAGEPIPYITGQREFWSLDLVITPATLIPRPETEQLVQLALDRLPPESALRIADLGTGSGAIALAIAHERPLAEVLATDISADALRVAAGNSRRLGIRNVEFRQGDWYACLQAEQFDLIVSNPPYLAATDAHLERGDLRFEPRLALIASPDGLQAIRTLIDQAQEHLYPGGWLLLEHGYDQGKSVPALLRSRSFVEVTDHRDVAGIPRVSLGRKRPVPVR